MTEELSKRIDDVHKRLDDFRADVNQRFAELREDMSRRFAELNHRFTTLTRAITVWGGLVTLLITLFGFFR